MKPEQMTEALEQVAAQVGVRVRYETMTGETAGAGGLCKIKGEWTVIIDRTHAHRRPRGHADGGPGRFRHRPALPGPPGARGAAVEARRRATRRRRQTAGDPADASPEPLQPPSLAELVRQQRVVLQRVLQRCAHLLADRGGRVGADLPGQHLLQHLVDRGPGRQSSRLPGPRRYAAGPAGRRPDGGGGCRRGPAAASRRRRQPFGGACRRPSVRPCPRRPRTSLSAPPAGLSTGFASPRPPSGPARAAPESGPVTFIARSRRQ